MVDTGPIETAYVEIKPKISPAFAKQVRDAILPELKKVGLEASAAFNQIEESSRSAALGVRGVTRSLNSASKAASQFGSAAVRDAAAMEGLGAAARAASRETTRGMASASKGLRNLQTETEKSTKHFQTLRYTMRSAFRTAVFASAAGVAAMGAFGVKAAADLEQVKIAFEGLLGGSSAADEFIDRLQKFAARTPFEFQDVAKGSQKLIALGQTGDQAIKTLTTVGNAAAAVGASGESINRVVLALSQIQAKGKLQAEELNQIAEALPNFKRAEVIQNLADAFGVSTAKIQEFQQKGMIPAQAGIDAVLKSLQAVPGALGAMDRQADTLKGKFSTFKDTIKNDFSNALVDSLPAVGGALDQLTATIHTQLQSFGPALGQFVTVLGPVVSDIVNALGPTLTAVLGAIGPVLQALTPALIPIGQVISQIVSVLAPALIPIASGLTALFQGLGAGLLPIISALQPLLLAIGNAIGPIFGTLAPILQQLLEAFAPLVATLSQALVPLFNTLGQMFIQMGPVIQETVTAFANLVIELLPLVNAILPLLLVSIQFLVTKRLAMVTLALKVITTAFNVMSVLIRNVVVPVVRFLADVILTTFTSIIKLAAKAFGWVPGLGGQLKQAAAGVEAFKDQVNASLDQINTDIVVNVTTNFITDPKAQAKAAARQSRITAALIAAGGTHYSRTLSPAERQQIIAQVDAEIAAEEAARKKKKPAPAPVTGSTALLPDTRSSVGGGSKAKGKTPAEKAAEAARKAAIKAADAVLAAAKKMADGIKAKLSDATDRLKKLREEFAQVRDSIADVFRAENLFESRSAKQFLKRASRNITQNTSVLAAERSLQQRLGNQSGGAAFLKELFASGNVKLIKNLAAESSNTLAEVLAKFNQDNKLALKIGSAVASAQRVAGVPIVTAIHRTEAEIVKLRKELVRALAKVEAATRARARLKAAAGGIFTSTTDLQVAEAGREVVVPLTRPSRALELLLQSGALALPTVASHLNNQADAEAKIMLKDLNVPTTTIGYSPPPTGPRPPAPPMPIKVVKERTLNQDIKIYESGDARLTADKVAARTASHMDR